MKATDKVTVTITAEALKMLAVLLIVPREVRNTFRSNGGHHASCLPEPLNDTTAYRLVAKEAATVFGCSGDGYDIRDYEFSDPLNIIKLNDDYSAEILDGKVKVGCAEFSFDAIKKLHKAIKKL